MRLPARQSGVSIGEDHGHDNSEAHGMPIRSRGSLILDLIGACTHSLHFP